MSRLGLKFKIQNGTEIWKASSSFWKLIVDVPRCVLSYPDTGTESQSYFERFLFFFPIIFMLKFGDASKFYLAAGSFSTNICIFSTKNINFPSFFSFRTQNTEMKSFCVVHTSFGLLKNVSKRTIWSHLNISMWTYALLVSQHLWFLSHLAQFQLWKVKTTQRFWNWKGRNSYVGNIFVTIQTINCHRPHNLNTLDLIEKMVGASSSSVRRSSCPIAMLCLLLSLHLSTVQVDGLRVIPMSMASSARKENRNELSKPKREYRSLQGMPCTGQYTKFLPDKIFLPIESVTRNEIVIDAVYSQ